jgi:hypothetical protein
VITSTRLLVLVGLGVLMLGGSATPVLAGNVAWGAYSAHSFYTGTAEGVQGVVTPYWENAVAWGGSDKEIAFVTTAITFDSHTVSPTYAYQTGLLARYNTKDMDSILQFPGDSSLTDVCNECLDGTHQHILQVERISNGWQLNIEGSSVGSQTGVGLSNDYIYQSWHQIPLALEAAGSVAKSDVDNNFEYSLGLIDYENSPVGSGSWSAFPHGYSYISLSSTCVELSVGGSNAPAWSVVQAATGFDFYMGTTTYLTSGVAACSQVW